MTFSERLGLKPVRVAIQRESMDDLLKTELWNILVISYFQHVQPRSEKMMLIGKIWMHVLNKRIDEIYSVSSSLEKIKNHFWKCNWHEVYDFIEFVAQNDPHFQKVTENFIESVNKALEKHVSAYRIINDVVCEITSNEAIESIERAFANTDAYATVKIHLATALQFMSDRENPDYRNSIKESISAVEALCKIITGDDKATLKSALAIIEKRNKLHSALKGAFDKLYAYAGDASGIRHALTDEPNLTSEDAQFMLVSCSAFINYLINLNSSQVK
jgi:hypothetical protein